MCGNFSGLSMMIQIRKRTATDYKFLFFHRFAINFFGVSRNSLFSSWMKNLVGAYEWILGVGLSNEPRTNYNIFLSVEKVFHKTRIRVTFLNMAYFKAEICEKLPSQFWSLSTHKSLINRVPRATRRNKRTRRDNNGW